MTHHQRAHIRHRLPSITYAIYKTLFFDWFPALTWILQKYRLQAHTADHTHVRPS